MADTPENTTPETSTAGIQPDAETVTTEAKPAKSKITRYIVNFTLGGALIMLVIALGSLVLARYGIMGKLSGFRSFMMTMYPFAALAVIAVIGIVIGVVRKRGAAVDGNTVIATLKAKIANFKVPKAVFVVDELPRNAMGKVQKNLLGAQHQALFAA